MKSELGKQLETAIREFSRPEDLSDPKIIQLITEKGGFRRSFLRGNFEASDNPVSNALGAYESNNPAPLFEICRQLKAELGITMQLNELPPAEESPFRLITELILIYKGNLLEACGL